MAAFAPLLVLLGVVAAAPEPQGSPSPSPCPAPQSTPAPEPPKLAVSAYVEVFYGHNFNRPSNGITNFRGFDNRHDRITLANAVLDTWTLMGMVCNGWNSVVDNNGEKSIAFQATRDVANQLFLSALYFGGVERPTNAPEGQPWRSLFDTYGSWTATPSLSLGWQLDAGFEPNRFGTSSWRAGAENALGQASPIFFPARRVSSATLTLEARPETNLSLRLEYRRDGASAPIYFKDGAGRSPDAAEPFLPTAKSQQTLTLAFLAWF